MHSLRTTCSTGVFMPNYVSSHTEMYHRNLAILGHDEVALQVASRWLAGGIIHIYLQFLRNRENPPRVTVDTGSYHYLR